VKRQFRRPAWWLVGGLIAIVLGIGFAAETVSATGVWLEVRDTGELPSCADDFAEGCLTTRPAVVVEESFFCRHCWLSGNERILLDVDDHPPDADRSFSFRKQPHRDEILESSVVTMIYLGERAAWVEVPSGARIATDEHPLWDALFLGPMGLTIGGGGLAAVQIAQRTARRNGSWRRISNPEIEPTRIWIIPAVGLLAFFVQLLFPTPPVVLSVLFGSVIGVLLWAKIKGRFRPAPARHRRRAV
jgi:hypothetical protein